MRWRGRRLAVIKGRPFWWRRSARAPYNLKQRSIALLPNLFTLGNAFFGFSSLVFVAQGAFVAGAFSILLGSLMDALDGRIARFTGNASLLGLQLDSLCDAISFCVAPAFLMYFWQLKRLGIVGFLACGLFVVLGVLRLARFNITADQQFIYFKGLPTTLAASCLVLTFLTYNTVTFTVGSRIFLLLGVVSLAMLMVSSCSFPTGKRIKKTWAAGAGLFMVIALSLFGFITAAFWMLALYLIGTLVWNISVRCSEWLRFE